MKIGQKNSNKTKSNEKHDIFKILDELFAAKKEQNDAEVKVIEINKKMSKRDK